MCIFQRCQTAKGLCFVYLMCDPAWACCFLDVYVGGGQRCAQLYSMCGSTRLAVDLQPLTCSASMYTYLRVAICWCCMTSAGAKAPSCIIAVLRIATCKRSSVLCWTRQLL